MVRATVGPQETPRWLGVQRPRRRAAGGRERRRAGRVPGYGRAGHGRGDDGGRTGRRFGRDQQRAMGTRTDRRKFP